MGQVAPTRSSVGTADLNPAQRRVLTDLIAAGTPRPTFDPDTGSELRSWLESALEPVIAGIGEDRELTVAKHDLVNVHACERYWSVERRNFGWNPYTARGTVAHKAIERSIFRTDCPAPLDVVDDVIARLQDESDRSGLGRWLAGASPDERAELRSGANQAVIAFEEGWPPIPSRWRPRCEAPLRTWLCRQRVRLSGKPDLMLGRTDANRAGVLIVDLKTGRANASHVDDLRFYALLHTLQLGVPPFRVASYYLDSADFYYEDVTVEILETAVRRTVDGVKAIVRASTVRPPQEPAISPGPVCNWCSVRLTCPGPGQLAGPDDDPDPELDPS